MDPITKALKKLSEKDQTTLKEILLRIQKRNLAGLDVKKLKGRTDIYRVRKGKHRVIFLQGSKTNHILSLERRNDTTYE